MPPPLPVLVPCNSAPLPLAASVCVLDSSVLAAQRSEGCTADLSQCCGCTSSGALCPLAFPLPRERNIIPPVGSCLPANQPANQPAPFAGRVDN